MMKNDRRLARRCLSNRDISLHSIHGLLPIHKFFNPQEGWDLTLLEISSVVSPRL